MSSSSQKLLFGAADYAVFATMLAVSLGIGIYFGVKDRRSKNVQNYLMAGRKMNYWAVGTSLSFSFISAVTILGIPSEMYLFGSMYVWLILCIPITLFVVNEIYIPIFFKLNITSSYEYLQLRFNYPIRILGTLAYIVQTVLYVGVMIYAPSLAVSQVSGFNLWAAIFVTGIVCTIYTTLGGLKAVIWTDVFQGLVVIIILIIVMFMSASDIGGWNEVWKLNQQTNRFEFSQFGMDPRIRHSFWSVVVGLTFLWTSIFASTQSQVQRYLACASIANAKKSMVVCSAIAIVVLILCYATGWVMYAYFHGCDPLLTRQVSAPDQLLPLMVMRMFQNYPGLSGAFMAAVYAGCLSTVSSGINAMACVTSEDFFYPFVKWSDAKRTVVAKVLVFAYGVVCIGFACLSTILGNVLQTSLTLLGLIGGPTLGLYTLGVLFPFANSWGSASGFFIGLALVSWIYGGSHSFPVPLKYMGFKARTVATCPAAATEAIMNATINMATDPLFNTTATPVFDATSLLATTVASTPPTRPPIAEMYAVSYAYYTAIGMGATLVCGLIISLLTCGHRHIKDVDPKVVMPVFDHPLFRYALPKSWRRKLWCGIDRDRPQRETSRESDGRIHKNPMDGEDNHAFELRAKYENA